MELRLRFIIYKSETETKILFNCNIVTFYLNKNDDLFCSQILKNISQLKEFFQIDESYFDVSFHQVDFRMSHFKKCYETVDTDQYCTGIEKSLAGFCMIAFVLAISRNNVVLGKIVNHTMDEQ